MTVDRRDIGQLPEPGKSEWNRVLGPFFSTGKVSRLLGLTEEEVRQRQQVRTILGCETSDGVLVFPTFQFVEDEQNQGWSLIEGFDTVLSVFSDPREMIDDWTLASWIRAKRLDLEGKSIEDHLKEGKELEPLLSIATHAKNRWSH